MADTKLGRDLPGEGPSTPLPEHPMSDFTGYGLDADDIDTGYCHVPEETNPDTRTGGIVNDVLRPGIAPGDDSGRGFLYRGRYGADR